MIDQGASLLCRGRCRDAVSLCLEQVTPCVRNTGVILDEDDQPGYFLGNVIVKAIRPVGRLNFAIGNGNADAEDRPFAKVGPHPDFVAEQIAETPHDCQPQPKALLAALRISHLVEFAENFLELILTDADAGILDLEAAAAIHPRATKVDLSPVGIADRIADQVLDDLAQQVRVRANHSLAIAGCEGQSLMLRLPGKLRRQPIDQALDREILELRGHRPRIEPAYIQ